MMAGKKMPAIIDLSEYLTRTVPNMCQYFTNFALRNILTK